MGAPATPAQTPRRPRANPRKTTGGFYFWSRFCLGSARGGPPGPVPSRPREKSFDELGARGLQRPASHLCDAYVVHGEYDGPPHPDDSLDEAELVVEMMAETEFLFRATSYACIRPAMGGTGDGVTEAAKRAAVHEFIAVKGMPESELPARLRAVAEDERDGLEAAWDEFVENRDEGIRYGDDDDDYYRRSW